VRAASPLCPRSLAVVLLVLAAACTQAKQAPPLGPSGPGAPASASIQPDPPAPIEPVTGAWTDPEVLAQLAQDCHWAPAAKRSDWSPFSCETLLEQTCNYDECDAQKDQCLPLCKATCDGCGDDCVKGCDACKSACKDEACRGTCAARCGTCRQTCLREKDHCASAECGPPFEACGQKLVADWEATPCRELVPKFKVCVDACADAGKQKSEVNEEMERLRACQSGCETSVMKDECGRFFPYYRQY
jgi:hypothetical protein